MCDTVVYCSCSNVSFPYIAATYQLLKYSINIFEAICSLHRHAGWHPGTIFINLGSGESHSNDQVKVNLNNGDAMVRKKPSEHNANPPGQSESTFLHGQGYKQF